MCAPVTAGCPLHGSAPPRFKMTRVSESLETRPPPAFTRCALGVRRPPYGFMYVSVRAHENPSRFAQEDPRAPYVKKPLQSLERAPCASRVRAGHHHIAQAAPRAPLARADTHPSQRSTSTRDAVHIGAECALEDPFERSHAVPFRKRFPAIVSPAATIANGHQHRSCPNFSSSNHTGRLAISRLCSLQRLRDIRERGACIFADAGRDSSQRS